MEAQIQLGSRARIILPFEDINEDTGVGVAKDLSGVVEYLVVVTKPDGTEILLEAGDLTVTVPSSGIVVWDVDSGILDQIGLWGAQGNADDFLSAPVAFEVVLNSGSAGLAP